MPGLLWLFDHYYSVHESSMDSLNLILPSVPSLVESTDQTRQKDHYVVLYWTIPS